MVLGLLLATSFGQAQTIVVGEVIDSHTGAPIANASLYFSGTKVGCASNEEGLFMLRAELERKRTLVASAVGYKTQRYTIESNQQVGITIALEEKTMQLDEVFVLPGANPALPLMERIRKNRASNDLTLHPAFSYTLQENKELYISDIERKHLQRKLWKSLSAGMLQVQDSTFLIPLYLSQTLLKKQGTQSHLLTPAFEKSCVLSETDYSLLLGGIETPVNFYQNTVSIFGNSFLSPLASSGSNYYQYFLADSVLDEHQEKHYILHFKSKNPFFATFNGEMEVDSASCALRHMQVTVPSQNNVNYLSSLLLEQTYYPSKGIEKEELSLLLDFAVKTDTSHLFPTVLLKREIKGNEAKQASTATLDTVPSPVLAVDSALVPKMNILEKLPIVQAAKFIATIINTGYIPTGTCVEVGDVCDIIQITPHEGLHLGFPIRTNERLWKNVSLGASVGFGTKDRAWKGMGQIKVNLPTSRRHILAAMYSDKYVFSEFSPMDHLLRDNSLGEGAMDLTSYLLQSVYTTDYAVNSLTRRREFHLWSEDDWTDHLETQFDFRWGRMGYGSPEVGYQNITSYRYNSLSATFRLSWEERKADFYFRRCYVHSRYPILAFYLEGGSYRTDAMRQDNLYARLGFSVQQRVPLGLCGYFDYAVQGAVILGSVPYPMLQTFNGNQTYAYDPYRFTLMNNGQYAADRYLLLHAEWNMNGLLFNRIPGLRYLHWRELVEVKVAWGAFGDQHNEILAVPSYLQSCQVPYVEVGVGIGNILRVADLYSVWRLTHRTDPTTPLWSMRFRLNFGM